MRGVIIGVTSVETGEKSLGIPVGANVAPIGVALDVHPIAHGGRGARGRRARPGVN